MIILSENKVSLQTCYRYLKKHLMNTSDQVQTCRLNADMLFSAMHLAIFFKHACDHLILTFNKFFNFIKISRIHNSVSSEMKNHLIRFFKHFRSSSDLLKVMISTIMFTLFLNTYSSDMHDKLFILSSNRSLII